MYKIGLGYDSHQLVLNRKLILGGIEIPFEKGLSGHSDADVLIHAIIDAIIGALNIGSIGELFPNTDLKYKDINSGILLTEIKEILSEKKYEIVNLDSNLILENPKLNPFIPSIKKKLAEILAISAEQISVKAKTNEKMGFEGEGLGISAQCIVLLKKENN